MNSNNYYYPFALLLRSQCIRKLATINSSVSFISKIKLKIVLQFVSY